MWRAQTEGDIRHVWPDDEEHSINDMVCWCHPASKATDNGIIIVVHNSKDGREYIERLVDDDNINPN